MKYSVSLDKYIRSNHKFSCNNHLLIGETNYGTYNNRYCRFDLTECALLFSFYSSKDLEITSKMNEENKAKLIKM